MSAEPSRIEKAKRPMTEAQKAGLAKGRARLAASRQAVKDRVMDIEEDPINAVEPVRKPTRKPQRVIVEDESESEPEEIHVVRRRSKKAASKVVYRSEDEESDEEEEQVSKRAPSRSAPARRAPARAAPRAQAAPPREEAEPEPFHVHFF